MAKEIMIVFVYDTLRCLAESDDPSEAVLYFHPSWVSDSQRLSLCGQLMGVTHCLKAIFSTPRVLALHSGKFVIQEYGRYILAVGSDRNIPDWVLQNRAKILTSLIQVYHCDLQTLASHFPGENNPRFSEKLYQIFETYLPTLFHGYYMFQTLPLLSLPKSATNVFLESMQLLDYCRQTNGVVGGAILYNNKILATQLSSKLTSHLCVVDPYRIKLPAETLKVDYEVPAGGQLFVVYIKKTYYESLKKDAERIKSWHQNGIEKLKANKLNGSKIAKEPILGSMKRDKSLLFTAVPEEDIHTNSPSPSSPKETIDLTKVTTKEPSTSCVIPDVVPFAMKPRPRPNKLALSLISRDSIDEDPKPPVPPDPVFTGQTSVCSTPMVEFKRLHGNVMSICRNSDDQAFSEALNAPPVKSPDLSPSEIEELKLKFDEITQKDINDITLENKAPITREFKVTNENVVYKPLGNMRKIHSLSDIHNSVKKTSHLAAMRLGKSGITNKNHSINNDESPSEEDNSYKMFSMTIADPTYPVFTNEGVPISKSLYDKYLTMHYDEMTKESKLFEEASIKAKKMLEEIDPKSKMSPSRRKSLAEMKSISKPDAELPPKPDLRRKSLCLPLKSLGSDKGNTGAVFESSQERKKLSGVQLTPLMEKLSHLAFSDKSSGYGSRGVTPMEFKDFQLSTPSVEKSVVFPELDKKKEAKSDSSESESDDESQISSYSLDSVKTAFFVCGHHNMSMVLLIDQHVAEEYSAIQGLWEACSKSLPSIEQMCMEPLPGCEESSEAYSFLSLDPQWGAVNKGGPWASTDVATMGCMHNDFQQDSTLTEFIVRNEESLVFGTCCGGAEIYYQESGCKQPGLPTPADIMGTAPLKAKRRLQRDHSVTIF